MKGLIKTKHVFVMTLVVSIFIGCAGLAYAKNPTPTLTKQDQATQAKLNENYGKLPISFIQNDGRYGYWYDAFVTKLNASGSTIVYSTMRKGPVMRSSKFIYPNYV